MVMYANYAYCDPRLSGQLASSDQMMPLFIMDLFGSLPGLPGLLTSAVFSAALSTISSGLNALAAVAGEDVVKAIWPNMEETRYTLVTKGLAVFFGALTILSAFLASRLGEILQTAMNVFGIFGGPILGLFSSGMFFPWVNSAGAIVGTLMGFTFSFWLGIGSQFYRLPLDDPPLSIVGCPVVENATAFLFTGDGGLSSTATGATPVFDESTTSAMMDDRPALATFYNLSYTWWAVTSWLVTIIVANIVSLLTGPQNPRELNPRLICPIVDRMYCCLPERWKKTLRCGVGEDYKAEMEEKQQRKEDLQTSPKDDHINSDSVTDDDDDDVEDTKL